MFKIVTKEAPDNVRGENRCSFVSAAGVRCHQKKDHKGGHKPYPVEWNRA